MMSSVKVWGGLNAAPKLFTTMLDSAQPPSASFPRSTDSRRASVGSVHDFLLFRLCQHLGRSSDQLDHVIVLIEGHPTTDVIRSLYAIVLEIEANFAVPNVVVSFAESRRGNSATRFGTSILGREYNFPDAAFLGKLLRLPNLGELEPLINRN
jgi:hypothetical protein